LWAANSLLFFSAGWRAALVHRQIRCGHALRLRAAEGGKGEGVSQIANLGYVGFGVSDIQAWRDYATRILGAEEGSLSSDGAIRLRLDHHAYRILLVDDPADDIIFAGFEVRDAEALDALGARLTSMGVEFQIVTEEDLKARDVLGMLRFVGPDGLMCEAYYGPLIHSEHPFRSPRSISGFVTGEQGIGHLNLFVSSNEEAKAFFCDALGFVVSDYIDMKVDNRDITGTFLHCNPRHHSIAYVEADSPKKLHHLMLQVRSLDDVGSTLDLVQSEGVKVSASLGKHTNDEIVSFYMKTPSGFDLEYGWGGIEVHDAEWRVQRHIAISVWGHRPAMN